ncbi:hypothetical protein ACFVRU_02850 [Streptomyces sp. NPDC057927]
MEQIQIIARRIREELGLTDSPFERSEAERHASREVFRLVTGGNVSIFPAAA